MSLAVDVWAFAVYIVQELGVVLGTGAETIVLVVYLLVLHTRHDGHTRLGHTARMVRFFALAMIVVSGALAVWGHVQMGEFAVLWAPAFIFKWVIIAAALALLYVEKRGVWPSAVRGAAGAQWYALFIVHMAAPVISWQLLLEIYAGWLAVFGVIWTAFVWLMQKKEVPKPTPIPAQVPVPTPVAALKSASAQPLAKPTIEKATIEVLPTHSLLPAHVPAPLPVVVAAAPAPMPKPIETPKPAAPVSDPKPVPAPQPHITDINELPASELPALRVMPKRPEDIAAANRGPVVKLTD